MAYNVCNNGSNSNSLNSNLIEGEKMILENIKKINNCLNRTFRAMADSFGLTGQQFFTLGFILKESKKREVTQQAIERFGEIRKSSVSSIITNLEKGGFINRKSSEIDSRANVLIPTEKAYEIERKIESKGRKMRKELFKDFDEENLKICDDVLFKMQQKLKEFTNKEN